MDKAHSKAKIQHRRKASSPTAYDCNWRRHAPLLPAARRPAVVGPTWWWQISDSRQELDLLVVVEQAAHLLNALQIQCLEAVTLRQPLLNKE